MATLNLDPTVRRLLKQAEDARTRYIEAVCDYQDAVAKALPYEPGVYLDCGDGRIGRYESLAWQKEDPLRANLLVRYVNADCSFAPGAASPVPLVRVVGVATMPRKSR